MYIHAALRCSQILISQLDFLDILEFVICISYYLLVGRIFHAFRCGCI